MPATEVRKRMGEPAHVARQLLYQRSQEHWIYQKPSPVCLVFDWQRGKIPRLVDIRATSSSPDR